MSILYLYKYVCAFHLVVLQEKIVTSSPRHSRCDGSEFLASMSHSRASGRSCAWSQTLESRSLQHRRLIQIYVLIFQNWVEPIISTLADSIDLDAWSRRKKPLSVQSWQRLLALGHSQSRWEKSHVLKIKTYITRWICYMTLIHTSYHTYQQMIGARALLFNEKPKVLYSLMVMLSSQMIGYGWAG